MTNIYIITNLITKQQYVGKTIKSIQERFKEHCENYRTSSNKNMYIHNAIKQYGKENFKVELLDCVDDKDWKYWETFYIEKYNTYYKDGGYNLTHGGDDNPMDNEVVRKRQYDATHTKEFIELQRKLSIGKKHTLESRKKMGVIQREVQNRPEIKEKIIMHQPKRTPVAIIDEEGNIVKKFISLGEAAVYCGKLRSLTTGINEVADKFNKNGKRARFFGYMWTKKF